MSSQPLTKDARGFVDGVVGYLRHGGTKESTLPKVQALLQRVTERAQKETAAKVETAVNLSPGEKQELGAILARLIGHRVDLETRVSPQLLGGVRITVGDWVVDTTLAYQLEYMARNLL